METDRNDSAIPRISRRTLLQGVAAGATLIELGGIARAQGRGSTGPRVVVVGAGAFGGWTALHLVRKGARVTLLDAWGPGHSRASSGGETRIIRATYGPDRPYYKLVARSLELWRENQKRWNRPLYRKTGLLRWTDDDADPYARAALTLLKEEGFAFEKLTPAEAGRRYPQVDFVGIPFIIWEEDAGYLLARRACAAVMEAVIAEGGQYRQLKATPGSIDGGEMKGLVLSDGSTLQADQYVFACGPWLGKLFPGAVEITPTRQEVFYFGTAAGDTRFQEDAFPCWIDGGKTHFYGIPGNEWRGFKIANDAAGPVVDPETQERSPTPADIEAARKYMAMRFPSLKNVPLTAAEVCQYERSADRHYVVDRVPRAQNVWLVGGGSGHGYKCGPAFGEFVADCVLGKKKIDPFFSLARLAKS
jgi:monomeric sarcosine oxidase